MGTRVPVQIVVSPLSSTPSILSDLQIARLLVMLHAFDYEDSEL
jgi:hypothetical protein